MLRTSIQRIPDFNINIFIYFWGSVLPKKEQGVILRFMSIIQEGNKIYIFDLVILQVLKKVLY